MLALDLAGPGRKLQVLCLGAHADDVEIGAGGALLSWIEAGAELDVHWCVASASGVRAQEAQASALEFLTGAANVTLALADFRDAYFPYEGAALKAWVEQQKPRMKPDIVLTHAACDAHQDHRQLNELAWNAFRDSLILEFEIPKWDGDLGRPNVYVAIEPAILERKLALLQRHFGSQRSKDWFTEETFRALARLRGVECRARYAEAFYVRKLLVR